MSAPKNMYPNFYPCLTAHHVDKFGEVIHTGPKTKSICFIYRVLSKGRHKHFLKQFHYKIDQFRVVLKFTGKFTAYVLHRQLDQQWTKKQPSPRKLADDNQAINRLINQLINQSIKQQTRSINNCQTDT